MYSNNVICIYNGEDAYNCGQNGTYTFTHGAEPYVYRLIDESVEKGSSTIYITDYFLKVYNDICYGNYSESMETGCSSIIADNEFIDNDFVKE